jgi:hypothetical protein
MQNGRQSETQEPQSLVVNRVEGLAARFDFSGFSTQRESWTLPNTTLKQLSSPEVLTWPSVVSTLPLLSMPRPSLPKSTPYLRWAHNLDLRANSAEALHQESWRTRAIKQKLHLHSESKDISPEC